jgi:hypothetical protein
MKIEIFDDRMVIHEEDSVTEYSYNEIASIIYSYKGIKIIGYKNGKCFEKILDIGHEEYVDLYNKHLYYTNGAEILNYDNMIVFKKHNGEIIRIYKNKILSIETTKKEIKIKLYDSLEYDFTANSDDISKLEKIIYNL